MNTMRTMLTWGLAVGVAVLVAAWLAVESRAQAPEKASLVGLWIRNHELSDQMPERGERRGEGQRGYGGGRRGRGGFGGGGFGRGARGGDHGADRAATQEETARLREALRQIMDPGEHLTITQTDSMVVLTDQDGRTTRLSPDGKKIKDDNTHIERKTRWEAGKLITEISGLAGGKATQILSIDPDTHRLRIAIENEGGDKQKRTTTYVYDAQAR